MLLFLYYNVLLYYLYIVIQYFIKLTKESKPLDSLFGIQLALWYAMKNNWDMAHNIVQDINTDSA